MNEFIATASREVQDNAGTMRTFSGRYVKPLAMTLADLDIRDIAHHLANECRYAGAVPIFYSVAQHSILVSGMFHTPELQMAGLLHDASEAYLKDIPSPIKHDPRFSFYRLVERELTELIFTRFGVNPDLIIQMKEADNAVFRAETRALWGGEEQTRLVQIMPPGIAEGHFLEAFYKYQSAMKGNERI